MSFQQEMDQAIKNKRLYFIGQSLPSDWYAAVIQWSPLAEAGDPKAQYNLGRCFSRGDGIDQDYEMARFWLEKAAEQNDPRAIFNLSILFQENDYKNRDVNLSEDYLAKAAALNEPRALSVYKERKVEEIELNNKKEAQKLQEMKTQKLEALNLFLRKVNKALGEKNLQKAKSLVLEEGKANPDFTDKETILAILNLDFKSSFKTRTNSVTSSGAAFQGTTQYVTVNYLYKTAEVIIKNTSKIDLIDLSFSFPLHTKTRLDANPYSTSITENKVILRPEQETTIYSKEFLVLKSQEDTPTIEGVRITFPLQDSLKGYTQHLVIYFDKPIIFKDDRLGFFSYLFIAIVIVILWATF